MDAMYPSPALMAPRSTARPLTHFDGKPMSSFILSLDGCAEECVSYDFWAPFPASPAGSTTPTAPPQPGAGIAGHWNNPTAKQYAKNLDPNAVHRAGRDPRCRANGREHNPAVKPYLGVPFHDSAYQGGPQLNPGKLQNETTIRWIFPTTKRPPEPKKGSPTTIAIIATAAAGTFNGKGTYLKGIPHG